MRRGVTWRGVTSSRLCLLTYWHGQLQIQCLIIIILLWMCPKTTHSFPKRKNKSKKQATVIMSQTTHIVQYTGQKNTVADHHLTVVVSRFAHYSMCSLYRPFKKIWCDIAVSQSTWRNSLYRANKYPLWIFPARLQWMCLKFTLQGMLTPYPRISATFALQVGSGTPN